MRTSARIYITVTIAAVVAVLVAVISQWQAPEPRPFALYLLATAAGAMLKVRLPGIAGTYSVTFVSMLFGILHFGLPETLIAGCGAAILQSVVRSQKRPALVQIAFNIANFTLTIGLSYVIARHVFASGLTAYRPAVLCLVAATYFVVNTMLVSGILALLEGKPFTVVAGAWYVWSFPYYLLGAALVGLVPSGGWAASAESWLIVIPIAYLLHFFYGLRRTSSGAESNLTPTDSARMPRSARLYAEGVIVAGIALLAHRLIHWTSQDLVRFGVYLALAVALSAIKVRLPKMTGTISPGFVLLLVAALNLTLSETLLMAGAAGLIQCLWNPSRPPTTVQVLFNSSCLMLSAGAAFAVCRVILPGLLGSSIVPCLVVATAVLYSINTVLVAAVLCLLDRNPITRIWQNCSFWAFPYYAVGAAAAGLMLQSIRLGGWEPSVAVLSIMILVTISYRLQIGAWVKVAA